MSPQQPRAWSVPRLRLLLLCGHGRNDVIFVSYKKKYAITCHHQPLFWLGWRSASRPASRHLTRFWSGAQELLEYESVTFVESCEKQPQIMAASYILYHLSQVTCDRVHATFQIHPQVFLPLSNLETKWKRYSQKSRFLLAVNYITSNIRNSVATPLPTRNFEFSFFSWTINQNTVVPVNILHPFSWQLSKLYKPTYISR